MTDYYQILNCPPNATLEELRKAWRKKCLECHPDNPDGGNTTDFLNVMHAYKMLTDPSYKNEMQQQHKDLTFRVNIVIDFTEAFFGKKITISYNKVYLDNTYQQIKDHAIEPVTLSMDIPPGSTNGLEALFTTMGIACGLQHGDTIIKIGVRNHPRYTVKDIDVYADEEVPLDIMLKGGEITVQTLWGHKTIWVPAGTKPGEKIRIYESGVQKKGYQYSTIKPVFPDRNELKKETWKGLNINWDNVEKKNKEDEELMIKYEELRKSGK
jgi:DnaJ-class molecular chaperone